MEDTHFFFSYRLWLLPFFFLFVCCWSINAFRTIILFSFSSSHFVVTSTAGSQLGVVEQRTYPRLVQGSNVVIFWSIWRHPVRSHCCRHHQWRHTHINGCMNNEESQKNSDGHKDKRRKRHCAAWTGGKDGVTDAFVSVYVDSRAPLLRLTKFQPHERIGKTTRQCRGPAMKNKQKRIRKIQISPQKHTHTHTPTHTHTHTHTKNKTKNALDNLVWKQINILDSSVWIGKF